MTDARNSFVLFRVAGEEMGAAVEQIREVLHVRDVTRVPRSPEGVVGLMNVRGQVVPIVDLRQRIGLPPSEAGPGTVALLVEAPGLKHAALVVDEVTGILRVTTAEIHKPPPSLINERSQRYLRGVIDRDGRLVVLCDLAPFVVDVPG